jgi:uncharacterized membrane protein
MKYALTIIFFLFCTYVYSIETPNNIETPSIRVHFTYPRTINSNGKKSFIIDIYNDGDIALYNLKLSTSNKDNLEITLDKTKIEKIEPKETIQLNMEIINSDKYYFSKDTIITLKISNDEFSKDAWDKFTIKPIDNFWRFIIISVALLLSILFIVIFIKTNKGEENAG